MMNEKSDEKINTITNKLSVWLSIGIIFSLLLAIGAILFNFIEARMFKQQTARLEQQIQSLHMQSQGVQYQFKKTLLGVIETQKLLSSLAKSAGIGNEEWILREAEYLVRLASFNLQFSQNLAQAKLLLQMADARLAALQDPRLLAARQSLTNSLAKLQAMPALDLESILLQLNALETQIGTLPIIATPEETAPSPLPNHHHQPGWKRNLQESWLELQKLVIIQYHNEPISHLISPVNRPALDMQLQLLLAQAEWAVIHGKNNLYQQSIQSALNWVKNYYVETSPKTQAMLTNLNQLLSINIAPALPDLSDTLNLLSTTALKLKEEQAGIVTISAPLVAGGK